MLLGRELCIALYVPSHRKEYGFEKFFKKSFLQSVKKGVSLYIIYTCKMHFQSYFCNDK